jgi:hypothetical protein
MDYKVDLFLHSHVFDDACFNCVFTVEDGSPDWEVSNERVKTLRKAVLPWQRVLSIPGQ